MLQNYAEVWFCTLIEEWGVSGPDTFICTCLQNRGDGTIVLKIPLAACWALSFIDKHLLIHYAWINFRSSKGATTLLSDPGENNSSLWYSDEECSQLRCADLSGPEESYIHATPLSWWHLKLQPNETDACSFSLWLERFLHMLALDRWSVMGLCFIWNNVGVTPSEYQDPEFSAAASVIHVSQQRCGCGSSGIHLINRQIMKPFK